MRLSLLIMLCISTALSQDRALAPRSSLLTGEADKPSASGVYVISFPPPNDCVSLGEIRARSRSEALYRRISEGGFTLKPGRGGLTVWTIEEWNDFEKEGPEFVRENTKRCAKPK